MSYFIKSFIFTFVQGCHLNCKTNARRGLNVRKEL